MRQITLPLNEEVATAARLWLLACWRKWASGISSLSRWSYTRWNDLPAEIDLSKEPHFFGENAKIEDKIH
jgi:hypothetical protein